MLSSLLTLLLVGLVAIVVVSLILALIGAALSLAGFLLFKVAPVVLIGWVLVRFLRPRHRRIEAIERDLLERG